MGGKIRIAVIGLGRMGSVHAENLLKGRVRNACLAAGVDENPGAAKKFQAKARGIPVFSSYVELIEKAEFDAAVIAVPHYFHLGIAKYLLERGKHALIEKPISVTTEEAFEFGEFLRRSDIKARAAVMYNQRTNPVYRKAKELIDGGALGEIRRINLIVASWYRSDAYYKNNAWRASLSGEGGGVLINQCVHQLDILQWLAGMPESIYAKIYTKGRNITAENEATAVFRYGNDSICSFSASGRELHGTNRLEIAGDKGRLVMSEYAMKRYYWNKPEPEVNANTAKGYGNIKKRTRRKFYGLRLIPDLLYGQQVRILRDFADRLIDGGRFISPAEEGIKALSLINGVYFSAWTGREISLPFDAREYAGLLKLKAEKEIPANKN